MDKLTQKEKIKTWMSGKFKFTDRVYTWELEQIASDYGMMSSSATRHARSLCNDGFIKHYVKDNVEDRHSYVMEAKNV